MRKEKFVTLADGGREVMFKIRQMPAIKQERWINRTIMLLLGSGTLESNSFDSIQQKFAEGDFGIILQAFAKVDYKAVEPLYDELLECCEHIPNPNNRNFSNPQTSETIGAVIEDVKNLYKLRLEALKVNFSFFQDGESSPAQNGQQTITITKPTST